MAILRYEFIQHPTAGLWDIAIVQDTDVPKQDANGKWTVSRALLDGPFSSRAEAEAWLRDHRDRM